MLERRGKNAMTETKTAASRIPPREPPIVAGGFDDLPPSNIGPSSNDFDEVPSPIVWLLRFLGFFFFTVAWGGHFLLFKTWPGSFKLTVCTMLGLFALLHLVFVPLHRGNKRRRRRLSVDQPLSCLDALLVTGIVILAGVVLTWLVTDGPRSGN
jgi:hypothetical protein